MILSIRVVFNKGRNFTVTTLDVLPVRHFPWMYDVTMVVRLMIALFNSVLLQWIIQHIINR